MRIHDARPPVDAGRRTTSWQVAILAALVAIVLGHWTLPPTEGLTVEHYSNSQRLGAPVLRARAPEVSFDTIADAWNGQPPPTLSARWTGYLIVERAGAYVFSLTSDDGSTLSVNDTLVIDNSGRHAARAMTGRITLDRGPHAIVIEYDQDGGDAVLEWAWGADGTALEPVPPTAVSPYRIGPATVWIIDAIDALFVPALAAAGVLIVWMAFPPGAAVRAARRRHVGNAPDA